MKATEMRQRNQTSADSGSTGRNEAPSFHVQTGIRAGLLDGEFNPFARVERMLDKMSNRLFTNI